MIVLIVHHWAKPDMVDQARQRIDQSGDAMSSAPGFVYRYRIEPPGDPLKISTFTAWKSEADFRTFRAGRPAPDLKDPSVPYSRVESELFNVTKVHGNPAA